MEKFECDNVKILNKEASRVLDTLIFQGLKFDSIFIGGSSGHLEEILLKVNAIVVKKAR